MVAVKTKKEALIKKHGDLVLARYELNEFALKVLSSLISMIRTDDTEFQRYSLAASDFKELSGLSGKGVYDMLRHVGSDLMKKPIFVPKGDGFLMFHWVASAEYIAHEGTMEFEISPKLKPYLLELREKFVGYDIKNVLPLKSSYVIRLYELFKNEHNKNSRYGKRSELKISVEEIRKMFMIPDSYRYNDIKRQIINSAQKQFAKHTDIVFDFEEIKTSRRVSDLLFTIKENKRSEVPESFKKLIRSCKGADFFEYHLEPDRMPISVKINDKGYFESIDLKFDKHHSEYLFFQLYRHKDFYAEKCKKYLEWKAEKDAEKTGSLF